MRYRFGVIEFDAGQYELRRAGVLLRVEPRVLDLLLFLIRNRDRVVPREELFDNLWKEKFIGEAALTRCVAEARKAIAVEGEDDPIKTIHRRGYRFVAAVIEEERAGEAAPVAVAEPVILSEPSAVPEPVAAPEPQHNGRFPAKVAVAGGIAIALLIVISAYRVWRRPAALPAPAVLEVSPDLQVTRMTSSGKATDAAISPDGKLVAYLIDDAGSRSIRVRQIATDSDRELLPGGPRARKSLSFTPDGNYVVYLEHDLAGVWALYRVAAQGGAPQRVVEAVDDSPWSNRKDASFTSDGNRVAFIRRLSPTRTALYTRHLRTHEERQILARDGELFRPIWIASETALLCHWKLSGYSTEIRLLELPLQSNAVVRTIGASATPLFVAHSMLPDQRHVIGVGGRSLGRTTIYLASYPSMQLTPITQGTAYWQSPSVTPDGRQLVAVRVQENYNLWTGTIGDADSQKVTSDIDAMEGTHGIDVTSKGELVYTSRTNGEQNHVWIASPDGRHLRQLTSGMEDEYWPVASPSGTTIFYGQRQTTEKKRTMRIWRMDPATGHSTQITSGSWDMLPAVTRDGRWILYSDGDGESPTIKRVASSGGQARTIAAGIMFAPVVSPDGKLLAGFHSKTISDRRTLVTMRLDDGSIVERFPVDQRPRRLCVRWAPDGRGLIVSRDHEGVSNLWLYPLGGGNPRQLTDFHSLEIAAFNLSPDGKHYVFSRGRDVSDVVLIRDLFGGALAAQLR